MATFMMDDVNTFAIVAGREAECLSMLAVRGFIKCERCEEVSTRLIANGNMAGIVCLCADCFTESKKQEIEE